MSGVTTPVGRAPEVVVDPLRSEKPARLAQNPGQRFVPVFQGETRVSDRVDEVMTTILGSCIATCVWDPVARVGGLNHFLLPGTADSPGENLSYGVNAMELLINGLMQQGAERSRLCVKIFGGADMLSNGGQIGAMNIEFASWYASNEGLEVFSSCVGGRMARKIRFWPTTGRVQRSFVQGTCDVAERKPATRPEPTRSGQVQLF